MYNNEPFEDYIRQVLGYPEATYTTNNMPTNNLYGLNNYALNSGMQNRSEIEKCYPEIYNVIYPMIAEKCNRTSGTITRETVEEISKEITSTIEPSANDMKININVQNESIKSNSSISTSLKKTNEKAAVENRSSGSGNLGDLVKILVIRELLSNQNNRPPMPPPGPGPRPPFPPGGRPPVGPPPPPRHRGYIDYNDIYEY